MGESKGLWLFGFVQWMSIAERSMVLVRQRFEATEMGNKGPLALISRSSYFPPNSINDSTSLLTASINRHVAVQNTGLVMQ